MRVVGSVPNLRSQIVFAVIEREIRRASERGLRVVHFSVQRNHVHMIVEAADGVSLSRGLQRFESRVAMMVNALTKRHGKFWRDRYHRRDLTSPSQVRNALVYVLMNIRKHNEGAREEAHEDVRARLDGCSSARWLDGWHPLAMPPLEDLADNRGPPPVVPPQSWLTRKGWKTRGLIRITEMPRSPG
jgi:putative transposase